MDILSIALAKKGGSGGSEFYNLEELLLQGSSSGLNIIVTDAVPERELYSLILYGRSIQTGTPTTNNPIPIKNVAQAKIAVSGQDTSVFSTINLTLTDANNITHKMSSIPNGKSDELLIEKTGLSVLYKRTAERTITSVGTMETKSGNQKQAMLFFDSPLDSWSSFSEMQRETSVADITSPILGYCTKCGYDKNDLYVGRVWDNAYAYITSSAANQQTFNDLIGAKVIMRIPEVIYNIPFVVLPSLPENQSSIWAITIDENNNSISTSIKIIYYRDLNLVINNIEEAIADIVTPS